MFKRCTVIFFALLYTLSAFGLPVHYHYCKGKLKHITLFSKKQCASETAPFACCLTQKGICKTDIGGECCDDELKLLETQNDQFIQNSEFPNEELQCATPPVLIDDIAEESTGSDDAGNSGPPPGPKFALHCAFLFYG